MLEWTPESIEAEIAYRHELRHIREAQGILGRPTPLFHWHRGKKSRHYEDSDKTARKAS